MQDSLHISRRRAIQTGIATVAGMGLCRRLCGDESSTARKIPVTPGRLEMVLRRRKQVGEEWQLVEETVQWEASETAIIVCDMWAEHPCKMAELRVDRMAPRMNEVLSLTRDHGVAIVHSPSSGIKYYEDMPYRARMKEAIHAEPSVPIQGWCYLNEEHEPPLPIDDSVTRGEAIVRGCDDPEPKHYPDSDRHQHSAIKMIGYDGVSDNGQEIFNFLEQEGRKNIVIMGVHTNMCVLGRPFGIRQQVYLGKNVVLCRDLTDALYDPRDRPYVSHARGVEMVIEHIEKHWCPTILGESLTRVVPGSANAMDENAAG
ncbi:MAG: isochorismatase family protein [Planctomycetaceae bacterium]|nr:isochorismatase family protein [Planctomycetaceae bacterium]